MSEWVHFIIHFIVDLIVNFSISHNPPGSIVIECFFFSFLNTCISSEHCLVFKMVVSFLFIFVLMRYNYLNRLPNLDHEALHFIFSCTLYTLTGPFDDYLVNFFQGVLFYTYHFVWIVDDNEQYFRLLLVFGNIVHLFFWYVFGNTMIAFILSTGM